MSENPRIVEIVCVGTEILLGNIVNTNSAFLAKEIAKLGMINTYQTVVGDDEVHIKETLKSALLRSDIVVFSGGMGPALNDLTKEVVKNELTGAKEQQKDIYATEDSKIVILLPGAPLELEEVFFERVKPFLMSLSKNVLVSRTIKLVGISEAEAESKIKDFADNQTNITIATYAEVSEVHIRLTAAESSEEKCDKLLRPIIRELKLRFGNAIYTTDENVTLEKVVVDLLISSKMKAMTVESCTAGMVSSRLVNVPGASDAFKYGLVTYSDSAKRKLAGVKKATLDKHTAVSRETALEMVKGIEWGPKADVIVGITGYASQGNENQPAGLVYISCNVCGNIVVNEYHFSGNRNKVRESATTEALILMRDCILKYLSNINFV